MTPPAARIRDWLDGIAACGRLGLAVSGGGDSMALLDLTALHASTAGIELHIVTVDHGLRPEAATEAEAVAAFCKARALPHTTLNWSGWDRTGNLQAEARAARYRLIGAWATGRGINDIALGHTQDDVAETFLIRLGRAAGLEGLSQMANRFEREGIRWHRPLLDVRREALRDHLRARGLSWAEDPSNADPRFTRVRARAALDALAPLGISVEGIARSAAALHEARAITERQSHEDWLRMVHPSGFDLLISPEAEGECLRRLMLAALMRVGAQHWPVRAEAMADLLTRLDSQSRHTVAGCLVSRSTDGWRIAREFNAVRDLTAPLDQLWDGRWQVTGPGGSDMEIRALGEGIALCPDWRETGLPRASLMAGPAVWRKSDLIAAPLARKEPEWQANLRAGFATSPFAH